MLKILTKRLKKLYDQHPKAWRLGLIAIAAGLLAWLAFIWWNIDNAVTRTDPSATASSQPAVKFVASPLTGIKVSENLARRPIFTVQIENSPDARPQSGLKDAGVIIEAIAEGGITRFSAYYQETEPAKLGPIRSLRPYFIDWLVGFDSVVLHVGGSTQARKLVSSLGVKSLDVSGAYYRASDRFAPHNAYSSYSTMVDVAKRLGHYQTPDFTPLKRQEPKPVETAKAKTISLDISSSLYNVVYRYDSSCNCYPRELAGNPHKDRESGEQLRPDVVVVIKTPHSVIDAVGHTGITTIGSGTGFIFQDGTVFKVKWSKSSRGAQLKFTDADGQAVGLNPGQTWITVMPSNKGVSYQP